MYSRHSVYYCQHHAANANAFNASDQAGHQHNRYQRFHRDQPSAVNHPAATPAAQAVDYHALAVVLQTGQIESYTTKKGSQGQCITYLLKWLTGPHKGHIRAIAYFKRGAMTNHQQAYLTSFKPGEAVSAVVYTNNFALRAMYHTGENKRPWLKPAQQVNRQH